MTGHTRAVLAAAMLLTACDGQHEQAGEKIDAAASPQAGPIGSGPGERLGELEDRAIRDQKRAADAQADAAEHRADEVRTTAEEQADALEEKADALRRSANQAGESLDSQADAIRKKTE